MYFYVSYNVFTNCLVEHIYEAGAVKLQFVLKRSRGEAHVQHILLHPAAGSVLVDGRTHNLLPHEAQLLTVVIIRVACAANGLFYYFTHRLGVLLLHISMVWKMPFSTLHIL